MKYHELFKEVLSFKLFLAFCFNKFLAIELNLTEVLGRIREFRG